MHVSIIIEIYLSRYGTHGLLLVGVKCKSVTQELWIQAQFLSFDSEFCVLRQGILSTLFWSPPEEIYYQPTFEVELR